MKIAIIGSRTFIDYILLQEVLNKFGKDITEVVSGGAKGADSLGAKYAIEHKLRLTEFKPDWNKYGKSAGYRRNVDIIENCDWVIAFWDGISKGTAHSINIARNKRKPTVIIYF